MKVKVFKCDCYDPEHQVWFSYDSKDEYPYKEMYVTYHIESKSFLNRLSHSIKYLFGFKSSFGSFSEMILVESQVAELEFFLKEFSDDRPK